MSVFEANPEGFRAQNLGRPASNLVRELVQNVLDENASECRVSVKWTPKRGVRLSVADDVLGGIRDESLIFTIWASDKQDSPTKRGRMGRGLKELVSVCDWTSVATQGRATTLFERSKGGEWKRKTTRSIPAPEIGTVVEASVSAWGKAETKEIVDYLKRIRPPSHVRLFVNGEEVVRAPTIETHQLFLPSVTYVVEDGERKISNRSFETTVELFSEAESWVYEMGLPIETVDFPLSIDVGQRVPMREQRDVLISWYKSELFAKLVSARIAHLPEESLRDNYILKAAEAKNYLSQDARQRIAHAWTEGKPYANTPQMVSIATGQHIQVVNLRTLPEAVREVVKGIGKNVRDVIRERDSAAISVAEETPTQRRLAQCWEWIAEGVHRPCSVVVMDGKPSFEATFARDTATLTLYREVLGDDFFKAPLGSNQLAVLIHELAHWRQLEDAHGFDFHSDAEHVGAEIAAFLMENYYDAISKGRAQF